MMYEYCELCPRRCRVNRNTNKGFCGQGVMPKVAKTMLHCWEEPVLSGKGGSGAVFFTGCTLGCVFCQNHDISRGVSGKECKDKIFPGKMLTEYELSEEFLRLQDAGAENIDLITATQFLPSVIKALDLSKEKLTIPVVFNSGGYERPEIIRMLEGYIDIYLPDIKYVTPEISEKYSNARDYAEFAFPAVAEMIRQCPGNVIIRHMVLPGLRQESIRVLEEIKKHFKDGSYKISLLSQYTPFYKAAPGEKCEYPEIARRITSFEYDSVVEKAVSFSMQGFMQEKGSAKEEYTPDFSDPGLMK